MIGFLARMVRVPHLALHQILKALVAWRAGSVQLMSGGDGLQLGAPQFSCTNRFELELVNYEGLFWDNIR